MANERCFFIIIMLGLLVKSQFFPGINNFIFSIKELRCLF